jgi:hypothetical protein
MRTSSLHCSISLKESAQLELPADGSVPTRVGAILLFLGCFVRSSFSDSLVSRLPRMLPLTELAVLVTPGIGV